MEFVWVSDGVKIGFRFGFDWFLNVFLNRLRKGVYEVFTRLR